MTPVIIAVYFSVPLSSTTQRISTSYQIRVQKYTVLNTAAQVLKNVGLSSYWRSRHLQTKHNSTRIVSLILAHALSTKNKKRHLPCLVNGYVSYSPPSVDLHRVVGPYRHPPQTAFATLSLVWSAIHIRLPISWNGAPTTAVTSKLDS